MSISARMAPGELERYRQRLLDKLPAKAREGLAAANEKSARDFADQVRATIPVDHGALRDTVIVEEVSDSETAWRVSVGGPEAPYPLALDAGHIDSKSGVHVPAHPFWWVSLRLLKKARTALRRSALRKALKEVSL